MPTIVTADEFLTLVLATIALKSPDKVLSETDLDWRFEQAYEAFSDRERELEVISNFTFYVDRLHGNSAKFRDALLSAREGGLVTFVPGRPATYKLSIAKDLAEAYVARSPVTRAFLDSVVDDCFPSESAHRAQ